MFDAANDAHRRYNPLNGTHVLVSPHRMNRPWNGQVEEARGWDDFLSKRLPCRPPPLPTVPFPTIPLPTDPLSKPHALFAAHPVSGRCRVVCFHPRHDLTLSRMSIPEIEAVIRAWRDIYHEQGKMLLHSGGGYVQIFENRGAMMGASAPHPHGQVWSVSYVPDEVSTELANLEVYDGCLLCEYAQAEVELAERVVAHAQGWVAVVPYWALWPFETLVLPLRHITSLSDLTPQEDAGLATVLKSLLVAYDNLFTTPFPYSMGIHQSPHPLNPASHLHFHFYPPLLRSASVRKFVVGFEMLAEAQRDLTPEAAAEQLRALPKTHYAEG
ncbi:hypothetical protein CcaverHIS002_0104990 [Cutaneotrichosporon cavernicola]|nr:hypothetical protein CcaverHIS002_0104990 [Cutaneotrichosporon cavernicola]